MITELKHRAVQSMKTAGLGFVITNVTNTKVPINPIAMSKKTAELSVRGHRPDGCGLVLLPGTRRL